MNPTVEARASSAWVVFATVIAAYQVLVVGNLAAMVGYFMPQQIHRAMMLAAVLAYVFLAIPMFRAGRRADEAGRAFPPGGAVRSIGRMLDVILLTGALAGLSYVVFWHEDVLEYSMMGFLDETGMVMALLVCIPLIEAVRRRAGMTLVVLVTCLVLMTIYQNYMPGVLYGCSPSAPMSQI